jgi:NADH:ubiquinone oxidoreductase subunit B-like Fe-S oxidoreductase
VSAVLPVDLHIGGCPPSPTALLKGLLALLDCVEQGATADVDRATTASKPP